MTAPSEAELDRLREELAGVRAYAEDLAEAFRAADYARKAAESGRDRLAEDADEQIHEALMAKMRAESELHSAREELKQLRATNSRLSDRLTENAVRIAMYRQERDRQRPNPTS